MEVMALLGFDFEGGRLEVSTHPFCGGVPEDVRITTRYSENELFRALLGVIHETSHARYEQELAAPGMVRSAGSTGAIHHDP